MTDGAKTENLDLPLGVHGHVALKESVKEGFEILDEEVQGVKDDVETAETDIAALEAADLAGAKYYTATVTSAELLALNATPKTIFAAPGANKVALLERVTVVKPAGTAYAGIHADEDLTVKYENASGTVLATIETTGFLDQTTKQVRSVRGIATAIDVTAFVNKPLVAHLLTGEITTGNSDLTFHIVVAVLTV